ncbi:hypothetical protein [Streptomyces altiplanensis]
MTDTSQAADEREREQAFIDIYGPQPTAPVITPTETGTETVIVTGGVL